MVIRPFYFRAPVGRFGGGLLWAQYWMLSVCRQRSGRRAVEDDLEMDLVNNDQVVSGHHNGYVVSGSGQSGQRRRRATTSSTELYSVDDLPRVTHLNDSEVSSSQM